MPATKPVPVAAEKAGKEEVKPIANEGEVQPLPELTLKNLALDVVHGIKLLTFDPSVSYITIPVLALLTSAICKLIIANVSYTEIDFSTYMQQISLINAGELDYLEIFGDSGPIVYPAGFVQIYQALHWITDGGEDLLTAQYIFGYLLTFTNFLAMVSFSTASNSIPPWCFYLLLMSKRIISIYVLRLFNDCFTTFSMIGVTLLLQQAAYWSAYGSFVTFFLSLIAADLFSVAISIKMNALLYLPGFFIVTYFLNGENLFKFLAMLSIIPLVQVLVGWKFLLPLFDDEDATMIRWNYISQAYDFLRKFLYEWTVNWRFVSEEIFLSDQFSIALLLGNLVVLLIFVFTRYLSFKVIGKSIPQLIKDALLRPFSSTASKDNLFLTNTHGPRLVMLTLATSNVIGVLLQDLYITNSYLGTFGNCLSFYT